MKKQLSLLLCLVLAALFVLGGCSSQSDETVESEVSTEEPAEEIPANDSPLVLVDGAASIFLGVTQPQELLGQGLVVSTAAVDGVENMQLLPGYYNWAGMPMDSANCYMLMETLNTGNNEVTVMETDIYSVVLLMTIDEDEAPTTLEVAGFTYYLGMPADELEAAMAGMTESGAYAVSTVYERDGLTYFIHTEDDGSLAGFTVSLLTWEDYQAYRYL